jgi:type IV pilus assembly protein PilX
MLADHRHPAHLDNQRGWVLVVGLVVLVMLTILAMALMKTTRLEEKMAGATREMNLSFQAAETVLRGAETFVENLADEALFSSSAGGLYSETDEEPKNLFTTGWIDANSRELDSDSDLAGINSKPRYMIKKLKKIGSDTDLSISGYGDTDLSTQSTIFRITARGTGGRDTTQTLLRSHYAKSF